jgi:hypothetical protein
MVPILYSTIHTRFQVHLMLKIWIMVYLHYEREKEVFYLFMLSTAKTI